MDSAGKCILCGGRADGRILFQAADWRVVECGGCGLIRQWPPLAQDRAATIYGNIYPAEPAGAESRPAPRRKPARSLLHLRDEVVSRHAARPGRILDIGCSYGELIASFAGTGWRTTGIDLCAPAVEEAKRRGLDCRVSSVEAFQPEAPLDAITMSHVLEHVPDPIAVLNRIKTWLAPGGTLHVRVPNVDAAPIRRRGLVFVGELKPYEHLFYYSASTMPRLFAAAGLQCEVTTGEDFPLGAVINAILRTRLVKSARWQQYNYFSPSSGKGAYFALRRLYEASLFLPNRIPLSRDRELRATGRVPAMPA